MSFVKPYFDDSQKRKYYDEREWRYVPDNFTEDDFNYSERNLKFTSQEIYQNL